MVLLFFFPAQLILVVAGPEEAKNHSGKSPPPVSDPFSDLEFGGNCTNQSSQFAATPNR
jgi:hypothetical protein